MDDLVRAFTTFLSWEEMKQQLDNGYVPVVVNKQFADALLEKGYLTQDGRVLSPDYDDSISS